MKFSLSVLTLLTFCTLTAQSTLSGKVIDANTGGGLSFATVRPLPDGKGVYTDGDGGFELSLTNTADSIAVSMVGYDGVTIAPSGSKPLTVVLQPRSYTTEQITVNAKKGRSEIERYGNTKFSLVTNAYSGLEGVKVVRYLGGDWERSGTLQSVIYRLDGRVGECEVFARVRIYAARQIGVSGGPGEELLHKSIIFPLKNSRQRYEIDLSAENINYPPEGLCVGVEFLGSDSRCDDSRDNFKNRFFVLLSANEAENVSYISHPDNFRRGRWSNLSGHSYGGTLTSNAKFGATVTY